jgi:hypothetical protein
MSKDASTSPSQSPHLAVAHRLGERDRVAVECIRRIVELIGVERAQALVDQARRLDAAGGMVTHDGRRRRTLGGIFFFLFNQSATPDQRRELLRLQARLRSEIEFRKRLKTPFVGRLGSLSAPVDLDDARRLARKLVGNAGRMLSVKIRIVGRPDKIERRDGLVVFQMRDSAAPPKLPKVLPPLPDAPQTYVVYMAAKHWLRVAPELEKSDCPLTIEGVAVFDPKLGKLVIYTQDVYIRLKPAPPSAESQLDQLRAAERDALRRIAAINALPFSKRRGLSEAIAQLESIRAQIKALQSRA